MKRNRWFGFTGLLLLGLILSACSGKRNVSEIDPGKLQVVATTSIVADVVKQLGGDYIQLEILLPIGTDPHSFTPTPRDMALVADADIVFANGAGLEEFLDPLIESAGAAASVVHVSEGIDFIEFEGEDVHTESEEQHVQESAAETTEEHSHEGIDPHVWNDPNNVMVWVKNITAAFSEADPEHSTEYQQNAEKYTAELQALDTWIRAEVKNVPEENRLIVTDHTIFNYFADEYGFEQIGAVVPAFSTSAEPSAQDLSSLEDAISQQNVKALFVGKSVNPALSERVSEDTGIHLVFIYTGSLSEPGGEAETYLDYMHYNVSAIVGALK